MLVVGAAGRTGREVVQRAEVEGHSITALVHSHGAVVPGAEVVIGDATDKKVLESAMTGIDAVIDAAGGSHPWRRQ